MIFLIYNTPIIAAWQSITFQKATFTFKTRQEPYFYTKKKYYLVEKFYLFRIIKLMQTMKFLSNN